MTQGNPWFEATLRDPYRDYSHTKEREEWLEALGRRGFNDITAQLQELTERFSENTRTQVNAGWANLGQLTGNDFVTVGKNGQLVTNKTKGGERSKETGYRAPAVAKDDDSWIGGFQQRMALSS